MTGCFNDISIYKTWKKITDKKTHERTKKLFTKENGKMIMEELNNKPFPATDTILEVKKGTLVLLHGRLPHYSCENKSSKSRHAYTTHIIDGRASYPDTNWLQRPNMPLKGFVDE